MKAKKLKRRRRTKKKRGGNKKKIRTLRNLINELGRELQDAWNFIRNYEENRDIEILRTGTNEEKKAVHIKRGIMLNENQWKIAAKAMNYNGPIYEAILKAREKKKAEMQQEENQEYQYWLGGRRRRKTRKRNVLIKIQSGGKREGLGFVKDAISTGADALKKGDIGGVFKAGKGLYDKGKGMFDKIGGFVNPGAGGGGGGGGGGVGGEPDADGLTSLIPCDENLRPEYPKGPDGCGKYESPKPTVKQLDQGYVSKDTLYQIEDY
jgi:hypothetical protein